MDNFDRNKVLKAALEVLRCTNLPFLLVLPDGNSLKTFGRTNNTYYEKETCAKSVSCRPNNDELHKLAFTFDGELEPAPELPENVAILSGTCVEVNSSIDRCSFKLQLDNGGILTVVPYNEAARYLRKNLKKDDSLKVRVRLGAMWLSTNDISDIISHTRKTTTTINLRADLPA